MIFILEIVQNCAGSSKLCEKVRKTTGSADMCGKGLKVRTCEAHLIVASALVLYTALVIRSSPIITPFQAIRLGPVTIHRPDVKKTNRIYVRQQT